MKTKKIFLGVVITALVFCFNIENINAQKQNKSPRHFTGVANTGDNMTIGIPDYAWDTKPQAGDEIGAFNSSGKLVGSSVFLGGNCAITVWGDDETTKTKEGVASGNRFTLRVWHKNTGSVDVIEVESWLEGDDIYKSNGISVIDKLQLESFIDVNGKYLLEQNIPNPAKDFTKVDYSIPVKTHVKIVLFTSDGKLVRNLLSEEQAAGTHNLEFDVSDLAAGTYYYKMITSDFSASKYLNVVK
ncbi:MAG: T9SS type A sorting domain-containing protein [Bacteroidota bacterium]|nr:T9SS type A sorting domain-containing protein [Bacteroidota bacterium]